MWIEGLVFTLFRLASAVVLTAVALYLTRKMWLRQLSPVPVWIYATVVLWVVSAFRWFVVWLLCENSVLYVWIEPWLQPMTQAMYLLLAMVIFVLTFTHIKERKRHFILEHEGLEDG